MFDLKKFNKRLTTRWLGQSVKFFEELDSTNSYLKNLASDEISHGLLCLTDYQTEGRGQYEKNWESKPGRNLTFTLLFKPMVIGRYHVLTLACAMAVVEQVEESTGLDACIKWPNDVYIGDKKAGGLLTETTFSGNKLDRLLIGIGLNINQDEFSDTLGDKATSLKLSADREVDREVFLAELLGRIEHEYRRWLKQDIQQLKQINQKLLGYGNWVRLSIDGNVSDEKAKFIGVNGRGELVMLKEDASLERYSYEQIRIIAD